MDLKEKQNKSKIKEFIHNTHEGKYIQGIHLEEIEKFVDKNYITKEEHEKALYSEMNEVTKKVDTMILHIHEAMMSMKDNNIQKVEDEFRKAGEVLTQFQELKAKYNKNNS